LVEFAQIRFWHLDLMTPDIVGLGRFHVLVPSRKTIDLVDNDLGIDSGISHTEFNGLLNPFDRMLSQ
jgi:hypothetical protein